METVLFTLWRTRDLKNTTIIAPNLDVNVNEVTTVDKGKKTVEYTESIEDENKNKGKWVEFKDGESKKTYESGSKPGSTGI